MASSVVRNSLVYLVKPKQYCDLQKSDDSRYRGCKTQSLDLASWKIWFQLFLTKLVFESKGMLEHVTLQPKFLSQSSIVCVTAIAWRSLSFCASFHQLLIWIRGAACESRVELCVFGVSKQRKMHTDHGFLALLVDSYICFSPFSQECCWVLLCLVPSF